MREGIKYVSKLSLLKCLSFDFIYRNLDIQNLKSIIDPNFQISEIQIIRNVYILIRLLRFQFRYLMISHHSITIWNTLSVKIICYEWNRRYLGSGGFLSPFSRKLFPTQIYECFETVKLLFKQNSLRLWF